VVIFVVENIDDVVPSLHHVAGRDDTAVFRLIKGPRVHVLANVKDEPRRYLARAVRKHGPGQVVALALAPC
jgi:hypothetical protein